MRLSNPACVLAAMLVWLGAVAAAAADTDADAATGSAEAAPPDLLLVTLDTTRADALGVYGGDAETPVLDSLARRGVRWRRPH